MYRARSKRNQRIRLIATYTVVPVIIVSLVTAVLFYILGYRINLRQSTVVQGGLVQFDSYPSGAKATLGDQQVPWGTATRTNAVAGMYVATMQKDGYRPWQKTVVVQPGKILWLNYARLMPTKLSTVDMKKLDGVASSAVASRSDVVAILPRIDQGTVMVIKNLSTTPQYKTIVLDTSLYTIPKAGQSQQFELLDISKNGEWMTIRHTIETTSELLLVRQSAPEQSRNLTRDTKLHINKVVFDSGRDDRLYFVSDESLYRMDSRGSVPTTSLAAQVSQVHMNNDGLVSFLIKNTTTNTTEGGYVTSDSNQVYQYHPSINRGTINQMIVGRFIHTDYVAAVYDHRSIRIEKINRSTGLPLAPETPNKSISIEIPDGYESIEFSPSGRFVTVYAKGLFKVYDLEIEKLTAGTLAHEATPHHGWLDDYHIWSETDGQLSLQEFDGENIQALGAVAAGTLVKLSENQEYLYAIRLDAGSPTLMRYPLLVR
jgi:hypothetical protein